MGGEVRGPENCVLDIASIVLAGGKGLRLGRDKSLEKVNSKGLLQRVVSRLGSFSNEIII